MSQSATIDTVRPTTGRQIEFRFERLPGADVPDLSVTGIELSAADRASLIQELNRAYQQLIVRTSNRPATYHFQTPIPTLPPDQPFQVYQQPDHASSRTPGLIFELTLPDEPPATAPEPASSVPSPGLPLPAVESHADTPSSEPSNWPVAFLTELHLLCPLEPTTLAPANSPTTASTATPIESPAAALATVIADIQRLQQSTPSGFAITLLAGYIALAERYAEIHEPNYATSYRLASKALDDLIRQKNYSNPCDFLQAVMPTRTASSTATFGSRPTA